MNVFEAIDIVIRRPELEGGVEKPVFALTALDDSYATANWDDASWVCSTYSKAGQSFTSGGGTLDSVKVYARKAGSATGNMTAVVYAHTGTYGTSSIPTGSALATSDSLDVSTLTTEWVERTLNFTGAARINLSATYYVLSLEYAGGDCTNTRVELQQDGSSPTHGGNQSWYESSWTADSGIDGIFYVYVVR